MVIPEDPPEVNWGSEEWWDDPRIQDLLDDNKDLAEKLEAAKSKIKRVSDLAEPYLLKYNITNVLSTESLPKIIENICKDLKQFVETYIDSLIDDLGDLEPDSAGIDYLSEAKHQIIRRIEHNEKGKT